MAQQAESSSSTHWEEGSEPRAMDIFEPMGDWNSSEKRIDLTNLNKHW